MKRPGIVFEPRKEQTARYAELFEVYKQLYPALRPVHHGLFELFKR
ncbi:MAG: hypothetical protein HZA91_07560 [Verrucomicrobia bacterium]|nr:hypothetical protein [Verrucomicrobiota bacterium]